MASDKDGYVPNPPDWFVNAKLSDIIFVDEFVSFFTLAAAKELRRDLSALAEDIANNVSEDKEGDE
jgi:N-glycosylase/DNA lyase